MALPQAHLYSDMEENGIRLTARQSRESGKTVGRYRRDRSSPTHNGRDDEPQSPNSDFVIQDAVVAKAPHGHQATRHEGQQRSVPTQSQAAAYPSPLSHDEFDDAAHGRSAGVPRRRVARHSRRASGSMDPAIAPPEPGPPPPPSKNTSSPPRGPPTSYHDATSGQDMSWARNAPKRGPTAAAASGGAAIDRIGSPTIAKTVLQPLDVKIREYQSLMDEAQLQMNQLDDELRAMQERRRQAEERYVEAKAKHDEYERRHADVDRALRGDFQQRLQQQQQQQQQMQMHDMQQEQYYEPAQSHHQPLGPSSSWNNMPRPPSVDSFDDRPRTGHSFGKNKPKGRSRFRLSFFQ
ncbi:hypothetical protein ACRALDRAFT_1066306 [Sodiomyces alcalophilus JCM 7366]|uniref:uncharacterized protein n=1 Tax=Sodiomyces alcalophilus JCM 7366 TaxID=591952 RepID=UPI0039B3CBAB